MSRIRAKLIYMDGKELFVDLFEKDLEDFADNISNKKVYWNLEQSLGFWTDIDKIRHITFIREDKASSNEPQIATVPTDSKEVSSEDERSHSAQDASNTG